MISEKSSFNMDKTGYRLMKTIRLVYFYAKHEHGTGIAGVSQFLFRNLTSAYIRLYPCCIKDYLRLDELRVFCALLELRIPIAPEPHPEKKRPPQV
jgi:hypothetical protein